MKTKNIYILFISLLFFPFVGFSQDIHFSQTDFSPLNLNPALAGANNDLEINFNYRNQWSSIVKAYQTTNASIISRINVKNTTKRKKVHLAAGLDFYNDNAGLIKVATNNVSLHVATHVLLGEKHALGLGLNGGWGQRSIDPTDGRWSNQYDGMDFNPLLPSGEDFTNSSFSLFDLGAGMLYTFNGGRLGDKGSKRINVGFAAYHLNRPNYSFLNPTGEKLYMRFTVFANANLGLAGTKMALQPGIYYQNQGPANEILLGLYWKYMITQASQITNFVDDFGISFGVFYRNKDALIAKALIEWHGIGFGFAYDFNVFNSLVSSTRALGAFEFALRYQIFDYSRKSYLSGGKSLR